MDHIENLRTKLHAPLENEQRQEVVDKLRSLRAQYPHVDMNDCLHFLQQGCTFGDALAVVFYLNNGLVLADRSSANMTIEDLEKEFL